MTKTVCTEKKQFIDCYPEASPEALPMFAENRVHQRTSGDPYPNRVVLEAQRKIREKREFTVITLENDFIELAILPEIGGKLWYARDKKSGYDFFYKNNVIKPALIGVLGSWTSGGLEFNWPFHHRASSFMPVDYSIEYAEGSVTVWMSEHDPIDRMKGEVGIRLCDDECIFETLVRLDNLTPVRRSFLWWENAAVPVNKSYRIFFPEDVNYVRFHYKRSVTTYPIANNDRFGAYNGILYDVDTDISYHKNTIPATSYFSAESQFDFFGGYDESAGAGVVHVADRHISPGKKMFTWAYSQLAHTWERALTDSDGQYAELMAGCYSDNQPDFAWLEPYESKDFSQSWFPIHGHGSPTLANTNGALYWDDGGIFIQSTRRVSGARLTVTDRSGNIVSDKAVDLPVYDLIRFADIPAPQDGMTVRIALGGTVLFAYTRQKRAEREIPEPRKELPYFKEVRSAQELYLQGVHIEQYRSPEYSADDCYNEALARDPGHIGSLVALARRNYLNCNYKEALGFIDRAEREATRFNARPESGIIYYIKGLILAATDNYDDAYEYFFKASWNADYRFGAMLHIGLIDIRREDYALAAEHLLAAAPGCRIIACAFLAYAYDRLGMREKALSEINGALSRDSLNLFALAVKSLITGDITDLCDIVKTDLTQNILDIAAYMLEAGMHKEIVGIIDAADSVSPLSSMAIYLRMYISGERGENTRPLGIAFPSRPFEKKLLEKRVADRPDDGNAAYLLGCLLYHMKHYDKSDRIFAKQASENNDYRAYRCLSAIRYSHTSDKKSAAEAMRHASLLSDASDRQITFESAYLMAKTGRSPREIAGYILSRDNDRDDITVELARAYNHMEKPEEAIKLLLGRSFVACEGGEHYIADQYMYAHYLIGSREFALGNYAAARRYFAAATVLPESLGSGLWNPVKEVPFRYFEAICLLKEGRSEEAKEILGTFLKYRFDYFSDMYLPTLAFYVARAHELLGDRQSGERLIREKFAACRKQADIIDCGYFGTTPFFISFIDRPDEARKTFFAYQCLMYAHFLGDKKSEEYYRGIIGDDGYGTYIFDII